MKRLNEKALAILTNAHLRTLNNAIWTDEVVGGHVVDAWRGIKLGLLY